MEWECSNSRLWLRQPTHAGILFSNENDVMAVGIVVMTVPSVAISRVTFQSGLIAL